MGVVVPRCSKIPCKKTEKFSTCSDNQTEVAIVVYEGERPLTKDCNLLGKFIVDHIPKAPAGAVEVEVTFDYDEEGILKVSAIAKINGSNG